MKDLVGWLRFAWTTLTSMRTALILLLVLGIAAVPGSLVPQRPTNPVGVADFLRQHPDYGPWLGRLGFFDVFGSAWFAAIYLLLFISLLGCIVPRTATYLRQLRALPDAGPGRLSRLPGHATGVVETAPSAVLDAAEAHLRARRYRVRREDGAISAERGYLRETGNLVFHLCLVAMLVGLAWGSLFSFKGTAIVVEGKAFSNTVTQYDEFGAGAGFSPEQLVPFTVRLDAFDVRFESGPVQTGAARDFNARVRVSAPGQDERAASLQVNAPLAVGGDSVHLLGHGYAPVVTVRDGNGDLAFSGPVVFLPQDANFRSDGVIKVPDARPQRLAFEGVFLPTAVPGGASGMVSAFPDALNPELLLNVWTGPPKAETGQPENVYSLDKTGLTQLMTGDKPVTVGLRQGATFDLPDGRGSISFDGWKRWTKLQVSNTPGGWLVLASVMLAVLGMALSLTIKPRRLFVRVGEGRDDASGALRDGPSGSSSGSVDVPALERGQSPPVPEEPAEPASRRAVTSPSGALRDGPSGSSSGSVEGAVDGSSSGSADVLVPEGAQSPPVPEGGQSPPVPEEPAEPASRRAVTSPSGALRDGPSGSSSGSVEGAVDGSSSGSVEGAVDGSSSGSVEGAVDGSSSGSAEPATTVSVAGLDRVDGRGGLEAEVSALAEACGVRVTVAATDDEEQQ